MAGSLVPDLFLFFKKTLYEVNASGLHLSFNIFRQSSTWHTRKINYKSLCCGSRDMLKFDF